MGKQEIRQAARRAVREGQQRLRREQTLLRQQAEELMVALGERDAAVLVAETRAGAAVRTMLGGGVRVEDVAQWCNGAVSMRELRRLSRVGVAEPAEPAGPVEAGAG